MEPGGSMPHSQGLSCPSQSSRSSSDYIRWTVRTMKFLIVEPSPLPILGSEALCDVSEHPCFYSVRLLASRQTPMLENHSWSAVHDCLFNIFAANLHIWRLTPPSANQGTPHAVVTGTHGWQKSNFTREK